MVLRKPLRRSARDASGAMVQRQLKMAFRRQKIPGWIPYQHRLLIRSWKVLKAWRSGGAEYRESWRRVSFSTWVWWGNLDSSWLEGICIRESKKVIHAGHFFRHVCIDSLSLSFTVPLHLLNFLSVWNLLICSL